MYGNFESPKFIASVARNMLWYPAGELLLMLLSSTMCIDWYSSVHRTHVPASHRLLHERIWHQGYFRLENLHCGLLGSVG